AAPTGCHQQKRPRRLRAFIPHQRAATAQAGYRIEDALDGHRIFLRVSLRSCGGPQEGEVATLIGAEDFLGIELGIAALGLHFYGFARGGARFELRLVDEEIDATFLHREADAVAAADQPERA